jgi:anti-sigma B factor antagonist
MAGERRPDHDGAPLRVDPERWAGTGPVRLRGEIDLASVDAAAKVLVPMAERGGRLVLDLDGLTYCDSRGVALFFDLAATARANGGSVALANPRPIVRRVFEIVELDQVIELVYGS